MYVGIYPHTYIYTHTQNTFRPLGVVQRQSAVVTALLYYDPTHKISLQQLNYLFQMI